MLKWKTSFIKVGNWLTTVKYPKTEQPCVTTIAHTGPDVRIWPHGTRLGFEFLPPPAPFSIEFSINSRSSVVILGWSPGESNTTRNQAMDHSNPITPSTHIKYHLIRIAIGIFKLHRSLKRWLSYHILEVHDFRVRTSHTDRSCGKLFIYFPTIT